MVFPFKIIEPFGSSGDIPISISADEELWIDQDIIGPLPSGICAVRAELVVDDTVIATSYDASILPARGPSETCHLEFRFPMRAFLPQHYGIRYIALIQNEWRRVEMIDRSKL